MTLSVTSFFLSKAQSTKVNSIVKKFTFNNSDISAHVTAYDTIAHHAGDVIGADFVLDVENASQIFNSLLTDKTQFFKDGAFEFGFVNEQGSEDLVQFFGGVLTKVHFRKGGAKLHFQDKLALLEDKFIGSDDSPVSYTGSNYNPADLTWYWVTSYGGLSTVKSDSNPDIDYTTWQSWWTQFDDDSVVAQAYFDGQSVADALEAVAKLTDSVIYDEGDNRLDFARWTGVTSQTHILTNSHIRGDLSVQMTGREIINRVNVLIGYDPSSETWAGTITRANTASVNSYGVYEATYDDSNVWFVNSVAAINQADRIVFRRREPNTKVKATTPLVFLDAVVGDMVQITSSVHSFDQKMMTLTGYSVDTDGYTMELEIDEGFGRASGRVQGFLLDDAYWGILDAAYNPLY